MCKILADQLSKPTNTFNFYGLSTASLQDGTVPEKATPLPVIQSSALAVIVPKQRRSQNKQHFRDYKYQLFSALEKKEGQAI